MMLTAAKFGADQLVYAMVTGDPTQRPILAQHMLQRAVPIALLAALAMWPVFGPATAIAGLVATLADTHAVVLMADLAARYRLREFSFGNILNYPLFFLLLATVPLYGELGVAGAAWCFAASSVARWGYIVSRPLSTQSRVATPVVAPLALGIQQSLNYLVFRGDQLLLPVVAAHLFGQASPGAAREYVYLARFPELVSAVLVTLAPMYLPTLYDAIRGRQSPADLDLGRWAAVIGSTLVAASATFAIVAPTRPDAILTLPFLAAAMMALPANTVTYAFLRDECHDQVNSALATGLLAGGSLALMGVWWQSPALYASSVAVALGAYVWRGVRGLARART